jgi:bifunctional UDP-N-acetylglucosamine pyrophosphorylase/glucosamine-1-phosphate N-acetyltransferase
VLKVDGNKVLEIVEKPLLGEEPSDLGAVGIYFLNKMFLEILQTVPREHYSLEKAISQYAQKELVKFVLSKTDSISLKYPWDILEIKNYLLAQLKTSISPSAKIAASAQIIGEVCIEEGAQVMENVVIKGPCYIGKNSFIGNNAVLRAGVDIEENSVIGANMEIKNTLVMGSSKTHSGFIGDSVIGINCRIAAGFCTANVRLDRETVKVGMKDKKIDSGLKSLGVMVGAGSRIGIKSSTMPGVIIGSNAIIGSGTTVMNNVESDTRYYTKFQETVVKNKEK